MMGAILMFTLSCLAIYISDFSEINGVEEGTGVVMLNCLYLIFTVGIVFSIITVIAGIIAVKGNGEGIFGFSGFTAVIDFIIGILGTITAVYVLRNNDMAWTSERRAVLIIWSWESCWFFSALQISSIAAMANSTMTGEAIWQRMYRR